jgi:hypothetical protein
MNKKENIYSITLNDDLITSGNTITLDVGSSNYAYDSMIGDINIYNKNSLTDTITITGIDDHTYHSQYEIDFGDEWRTHFPDFNKIEAMCKEYPALEKAFEKFKTTYEMVKDDYDSKTRNEDQ